jgi:hypothetical protein
MKEFIRGILGVIISSYWGGIFFILFGVLLIGYTIKYPQIDRSSPLQGDIKGWAGGIGSIIFGGVIIYFKIKDVF